MRNYFVAAGMNSTGIALSSGVGKIMAEWISQGEAPNDLWENDISRFSTSHNNKLFLRDRVRDLCDELEVNNADFFLPCQYLG